jgi:hypothetical protein
MGTSESSSSSNKGMGVDRDSFMGGSATTASHKLRFPNYDVGSDPVA